MPWAGVLAGVIAGVVAYMRKQSWLTPAAGAVAAAGWLAGPAAASAAVGVVAAWCVRGRFVRWRNRAHRMVLAGCACMAAVYGTHLKVRAATFPVTSREVGLAVGFAAVAVMFAVWRPAPPDLDPQRLFTPAQRAEITRRDGYRCGYCGVPGDALGVQLAVDHVVPHSKGGRTDVANGKLACTKCNSEKSDMDWADFVRVFRRRHGFAPGEFDHGSRLLRLFRS